MPRFDRTSCSRTPPGCSGIFVLAMSSMASMACWASLCAALLYLFVFWPLFPCATLERRGLQMIRLKHVVFHGQIFLSPGYPWSLVRLCTYLASPASAASSWHAAPSCRHMVQSQHMPDLVQDKVPAVLFQGTFEVRGTRVQFSSSHHADRRGAAVRDR